MGRKASQAERTWRGRMARFGRGTLTVVEFCRREGVSTPSFYAWRKRLGSVAQPKPRGKRSRGASPSEPASRLFVPVNVSSSPVAEIEFPSGVRVRVPATNLEAIRAAVLAGGDPFRERSSC
jgi:transposase-like protein